MVQRITGAAAPLILADGTHLRFSPLTDKDTEEIDEWLSARIINAARNSIYNAPQAEREEILAIAIKQAAQTTYTTADGVAMLATIPGMAFICWLSLRKEQPHLTVPKVMELLINVENLDRAKEIFRHVNGIGDNSSKKAKRVRMKKR